MASITLAVVPTSTPGDRRAALDEVCRALGSILNVKVRGATPGSYAELASELVKERVQYAWMSPALMVLTSEQIQLRPLLSAVRSDSTSYQSALFVDGRGAIQTVAELQGKTVAWVDATSASGYLYPRIHLAANGIDPAKLFGNEVFLQSHGDVVRAVFDGRADVGATYAEEPPIGQPITRAGFCDAAPDLPARVLQWTLPIPNDMIAGHGLMAKAEHRRFGNAILTLAERDDGRRLLMNAFHTERFMTTPKTALRPLLDLVVLARAHGLLTQL